MRSLFIFITLIPLLSAPASLAAPEKILFIGNSYTGQIRSTVAKLFAASPHRDVMMEFITPGGQTLEQHSKRAPTLAKISEGWDVVVLQDQSQTPAVLPRKFMVASEVLHTAIKESGARTAYYQTWGRRDGDKQNKRRFPTYAEMQDALSTSYNAAAKRDGAILVGVGEAWREVRVDKPELGRELYKGDGSHPSAKGAYLAACCFYATFTGDDPQLVKFDAGLPAGEAEYLAAKAWGSSTLAPITK